MTEAKERDEATAEEDQDEAKIAEPDLAWMKNSLEWGVRVKPGKRGLTVSSLNVGISLAWQRQSQIAKRKSTATWMRASADCLVALRILLPWKHQPAKLWPSFLAAA